MYSNQDQTSPKLHLLKKTKQTTEKYENIATLFNMVQYLCCIDNNSQMFSLSKIFVEISEIDWGFFAWFSEQNYLD